MIASKGCFYKCYCFFFPETVELESISLHSSSPTPPGHWKVDSPFYNPPELYRRLVENEAKKLQPIFSNKPTEDKASSSLLEANTSSAEKDINTATCESEASANTDEGKLKEGHNDTTAEQNLVTSETKIKVYSPMSSDKLTANNVNISQSTASSSLPAGENVNDSPNDTQDERSDGSGQNLQQKDIVPSGLLESPPSCLSPEVYEAARELLRQRKISNIHAYLFKSNLANDRVTASAPDQNRLFDLWCHQITVKQLMPLSAFIKLHASELFPESNNNSGGVVSMQSLQQKEVKKCKATVLDKLRPSSPAGSASSNCSTDSSDIFPASYSKPSPLWPLGKDRSASRKTLELSTPYTAQSTPNNLFVLQQAPLPMVLYHTATDTYSPIVKCRPASGKPVVKPKLPASTFKQPRGVSFQAKESLANNQTTLLKRLKKRARTLSKAANDKPVRLTTGNASQVFPPYKPKDPVQNSVTALHAKHQQTSESLRKHLNRSEGSENRLKAPEGPKKPVQASAVPEQCSRTSEGPKQLQNTSEAPENCVKTFEGPKKLLDTSEESENCSKTHEGPKKHLHTSGTSEKPFDTSEEQKRYVRTYERKQLQTSKRPKKHGSDKSPEKRIKTSVGSENHLKNSQRPESCLRTSTGPTCGDSLQNK